jgi:hypothetical protein
VRFEWVDSDEGYDSHTGNMPGWNTDWRPVFVSDFFMVFVSSFKEIKCLDELHTPLIPYCQPHCHEVWRPSHGGIINTSTYFALNVVSCSEFHVFSDDLDGHVQRAMQFSPMQPRREADHSPTSSAEVKNA